MLAIPMTHDRPMRSAPAVITETKREVKKVPSIFIEKVVKEFSCQSKNRYFRNRTKNQIDL